LQLPAPMASAHIQIWCRPPHRAPAQAPPYRVSLAGRRRWSARWRRERGLSCRRGTGGALLPAMLDCRLGGREARSSGVLLAKEKPAALPHRPCWTGQLGGWAARSRHGLCHPTPSSIVPPPGFTSSAAATSYVARSRHGPGAAPLTPAVSLDSDLCGAASQPEAVVLHGAAAWWCFWAMRMQQMHNVLHRLHLELVFGLPPRRPHVKTATDAYSRPGLRVLHQPRRRQTELCHQPRLEAWRACSPWVRMQVWLISGWTECRVCVIANDSNYCDAGWFMAALKCRVCNGKWQQLFDAYFSSNFIMVFYFLFYGNMNFCCIVFQFLPCSVIRTSMYDNNLCCM
jgi:hypothetical protein